MNTHATDIQTRPVTIGIARAAAPRIYTAAHPSGPVALHTSRDRYIDHVERHFASAPELAALRFAVPSIAAIDEFSSDRALIRALRCNDSDERSINVLEGYARCVLTALDEAATLGWVVSPCEGTVITLSTSGLLCVIESGALRTMFFAGIESAETRADRCGLSTNELAAERRREATWTADELHFYRVFRPALQLIRSMPDDAATGRVSQYGALKRVLPSASALRFEGWCSFRARCVAARATLERTVSS